MIFDIQGGTVYFKGCSLHCDWCTHPEGQNRLMQKMIFKDKCNRCRKCEDVCPCPVDCSLCGDCADICPNNAIAICGKMMPTERIMEQIGTHREGVALTGGECLLQTDALIELLSACKQQDIPTSVYTAGNIPTDALQRALPLTDTFVFTLSCTDNEKHRRHTGADNTLILANLRYLKQNSADIHIRIPLIPDINTDESELRALRKILDEIAPSKVEIIPYAPYGIEKAKALGKSPVTFPCPTNQALALAENILKER